MVLKSVPGDTVPVYQISGSNASRSLPDWLVRKRKQSLKNDPDYHSRIELLQDFQFEEASNRIKVTRDGQYAMATGTYKPQIHVYEFQQMSLKFDRHTDAENIDFVIISDDWTKSVHLQSDRTIELHAQGGIHERTRIPKFGRSIEYNRQNCEVYVAGTSRDLYRLNIDQGRFMAPFECDADALNVVRVNPAHGLVGCGTESGTVEFWDPRTRRSVGTLGVGGQGHGIGSGVTSLAFHQDGLQMAAGTYEGSTLLYDLRMSQPLLTKDQGYGFPIHSIGFLDTQLVQQKVWSSDKRVVKIWDSHTGAPFTSLEPAVDINDVAHVPGSGMFFLANEGIPMHTYYVPAVGPAPRWCSFLDNITEELEDKGVSTVYENYKFVTSKELRQLDLDHLVGSNVVRAYMHGYFIDMRLYEKARLISNPYEVRDHRDREIRKRIEAERESRIRAPASAKSKAVKVNKEFAAVTGGEIDDRFKAMFEDPEFEIDEESYEFKLLHGGRANQSRVSNTTVERNGARGLTAVEQADLDAHQGTSSEEEDDEDVEDEDAVATAKRIMCKMQNEKRRARRRKETNAVEMSAVDMENRAEMTLGEQLRKKKSHIASSGPVVRSGKAEITFTPSTKKKTSRKPQHDGGRTTSRGDGTLRKASKNTFRGM